MTNGPSWIESAGSRILGNYSSPNPLRDIVLLRAEGDLAKVMLGDTNSSQRRYLRMVSAAGWRTRCVVVSSGLWGQSTVWTRRQKSSPRGAGYDSISSPELRRPSPSTWRPAWRSGSRWTSCLSSTPWKGCTATCTNPPSEGIAVSQPASTAGPSGVGGTIG